MNKVEENRNDSERCCGGVCMCAAYFPPLPASGYTSEDIDRVRQLMTIQRRALITGADRALKMSDENEAEDDEFVRKFAENSRYLAEKIDKFLKIENKKEFAAAMENVRSDVVLHADVLPFMRSMTELAFSKRTLYPGLVKIRDDLIGWLDEHAAKLDPIEMERCRTQIRLLREMCGIYESEGDEKANLWNEMMQRTGAKLDQLCQQGSLPEKFVQRLFPGWAISPDTGLPITTAIGSGKASAHLGESPCSMINVLAGLSYLMN